MGGYDKGIGYDILFAQELPHLKAVVCYGSTAAIVAESAKKYGVERIYRVRDLEEAFDKAFQISAPGDDILLSPASASWDAYSNFEERGDHFRELVGRLNP
jgi:UDP-N-acetylmuramoylalanine--D-glutamate ligase